ncbi:cytochrome P450 [Rhypophila decipiens]
MMFPVIIAIAAAAAALFLLIPRLHHLFVPRPIPSIPYKRASANRILGDIPDVLKQRNETGEIWRYVRDLAAELNSPIFQMFMSPGPFGKPWVIIADFTEARGIQLHRQGEFDRSDFVADIFGPLMPACHVSMPSNDEFKAHRSILRDMVSPWFIREVAVPATYSAVQGLLDLWGEKATLAQGRPFEAGQDLTRCVVDLILLLSFGTETGLNKSQATVLQGIDKLGMPMPDGIDSPVNFPVAGEPKEYTAIRTLADSVQIGMDSPVPRLHMKFALNFYPRLAHARRYVDKLMSRVLCESSKRLVAANSRVDDGKAGFFRVKSAADTMVQRESEIASQHARPAQPDSRVMRDELFGLYLGGHETSSSTLGWGIKHLTEYQVVQQKLRLALRSAYKVAVDEGRSPTVEEIAQTSVPYLDAFIEENHRMGAPVPVTIRRATRDAVVLGHVIPKGTDVFCLMSGPSFQSPAFPVASSDRRKATGDSAFQKQYGVWDSANVGEFMPERWLVRDEAGREKYNPFAGPSLPYGAGLRGCFGIKLSVAKLKVIFTMIVMAFELQETPRDLSSFDAVDLNTHKPKQTYVRLVALS